MKQLVLPLVMAVLTGLGMALFPQGGSARTSCPPNPIPGSTINGGLDVSAGTCTLNDVQVNGGVTVSGTGSLFMNGSRINGGLQVATSGVFWACNDTGGAASTINGGVSVTAARVAQIGGTDNRAGDADNNPTISGTLCGSGERITGGLHISGVTGSATHGVEVDSATVNGGVQITGNTAAIVEVEGNTINGGLQCTSNGTVTNDGNLNHVTGGEGGQCLGL